MFTAKFVLENLMLLILQTLYQVKPPKCFLLKAIVVVYSTLFRFYETLGRITVSVTIHLCYMEKDAMKVNGD